MKKNISWVEEFRPRCLDDVTSQDDIVSSLKKSLITKNIPHLIFFGPSGCGKTSTILALARELFGKEYWEDRIIELNASDERGINVVRDKIKTYAKHSVRVNSNIPPWKIIILDEADTMTSDSQFALRRIMEEYSKVTRFCIICNYHNKIIDPIISRCSMFRFKPISNDLIMKKLKFIINDKKFNCSDNNLNKIVNICRGDLRKAINFLERCHHSFGDNITDILLDEISGIIPKVQLDLFFAYCKKGSVDDIDKLILDFYNKGYSLVNQIYVIHERIIKNKEFNGFKKAKIISKLVEVDQNLILGCDEYIQFMLLAYYIMYLKDE